ncbi:hypothetical protein [Mycobacterium sp. AZCC_0083]|uniref:hypothetical protein n=1 Tax=Mycobacterium sp. AZCC_0083 TaxID=2735882 RepID=UPI001815DA9F|nr:hypothetical protein [Mycobacterium sp. AZCC_0083]MBB5165030.1 hypothetical protein [Mycobacterium sp. AZCC_0083]
MTTAMTFVASRRLGDRFQPALVMDAVFASVLAGALWPLLLLGVVELSSVAAYTTLVKADPEDYANEVVVTLR